MNDDSGSHTPGGSNRSTHGGAVLLAAGFSRRFGSDKRRHRLSDGGSLLAASVALYSRAFPKLIVVLRPEDADLAEEVRTAAVGSDVEIVYCADAAEGMGRSLAAGAAAARAWSYLFVALADMPWVRPDTLQRLQRELEEAASDTIIVPVCPGPRGTRRPGLPRPGLAKPDLSQTGRARPGLARPGLARPGHPVGFGADYLPALATLRGDEGARSLVSKAANRVRRVLVEDVGVLQDLDTPPV